MSILIFVPGMFSTLQTIRGFWLTASSAALTTSQASKRSLHIVNHTLRATMADSSKPPGDAKPKIFVTRSDYPQNGLDLLQKK